MSDVTGIKGLACHAGPFFMGFYFRVRSWPGLAERPKTESLRTYRAFTWPP